AYLPWQSGSAGIDDDPAEWLPVVHAATGVDLAGMDDAEAEAACEGIGGSYHSADTPFDVAAGAIAHAVENAVAPLEAEAAGLTAEVATLRDEVAGWRARGA